MDNKPNFQPLNSSEVKPFMSNDFSYDSVPYQSTFQPQIYPDRMATLATILGMKPQKIDECRYLELGCGEGDNLIGFAFPCPKASLSGLIFRQNTSKRRTKWLKNWV